MVYRNSPEFSCLLLIFLKNNFGTNKKNILLVKKYSILLNYSYKNFQIYDKFIYFLESHTQLHIVVCVDHRARPIYYNLCKFLSKIN